MIGTVTLNPAIDTRYLVRNMSVGQVHRVQQVERTAGGKGINVSRVAVLAGEQVCATGFLGGANGSFIRGKLAALGIEDAFVEIEHETRICLNIVSDGQTSTELLEPGPSVVEEDVMKLYKTYESMLDRCTVIAASGSLPQGLPSEFYRELIQRANDKGVKFLLDTSGPSLQAAVAARPYFIKPNQEEIEVLIGRRLLVESDYYEALQQIGAAGIPCCVVSRGKEGSLAMIDGELYRVTVPSIEAVNPVGSGDSFVAGIAVSLVRGYDVYETLAFASACGTANAMEHQTGFIQLNRVEALKQQVHVVKL